MNPSTLQIVAPALFALALIHTFSTKFFEHLGRRGDRDLADEMTVLPVAFLACAADPPLRYVLEDDYAGWVTVEVGAPGVPEAPVADGWRQVEVKAGHARTGSGFGGGPARFATEGGAPLTLLEDRGVGYDEALQVTREATFVCCRTNASVVVEGQSARTFERFYVGRGPAGEPPPWPHE